jgi:predicted DCC family thiol-disulfide oxidoreductase YuxK
MKNVNGWILYDADCPFCLRIADRLRAPLARRNLVFLPLQTPWIRKALNLTETELLSEMRLLKPGGEVFGGADAWLEIARQFWWTWPLRLLARIPAVMQLARAGYRWIARHRHCISRLCKFKNLPPPDRKKHHTRRAFHELP